MSSFLGGMVDPLSIALSIAEHIVKEVLVKLILGKVHCAFKEEIKKEVVRQLADYEKQYHPHALAVQIHQTMNEIEIIFQEHSAIRLSEEKLQLIRPSKHIPTSFRPSRKALERLQEDLKEVDQIVIRRRKELGIDTSEIFEHGPYEDNFKIPTRLLFSPKLESKRYFRSKNLVRKSSRHLRFKP